MNSVRCCEFSEPGPLQVTPTSNIARLDFASILDPDPARAAQVYAVSTSGAVRHKCLSTIHRFLHYSPPAQLEALLGNMAISSFLAGLISGKDSTAALMGVTLAELLMTKLPAVFARRDTPPPQAPHPPLRALERIY